LLGDRLYYLGLLPGLCTLAFTPILAVATLFGIDWFWFWFSLAALVCGAAIFALGASLKEHAHKVAERAGIKGY
jgi:hypothetical protein